MNDFLRTWKEFDLEEIKKHLFVYGELSGECFSCHTVGIELGATSCPHCKTNFTFVAFRRHADSRTVRRFRKQYPAACFIEFEDFRKVVHTSQARRLLDI